PARARAWRRRRGATTRVARPPGAEPSAAGPPGTRPRSPGSRPCAAHPTPLHPRGSRAEVALPWHQSLLEAAFVLHLATQLEVLLHRELLAPDLDLAFARDTHGRRSGELEGVQVPLRLVPQILAREVHAERVVQWRSGVALFLGRERDVHAELDHPQLEPLELALAGVASLDRALHVLVEVEAELCDRKGQAATGHRQRAEGLGLDLPGLALLDGARGQDRAQVHVGLERCEPLLLALALAEGACVVLTLGVPGEGHGVVDERTLELLVLVARLLARPGLVFLLGHGRLAETPHELGRPRVIDRDVLVLDVERGAHGQGRLELFQPVVGELATADRDRDAPLLEIHRRLEMLGELGALRRAPGEHIGAEVASVAREQRERERSERQSHCTERIRRSAQRAHSCRRTEHVARLDGVVSLLRGAADSGSTGTSVVP